MDCWMSCTSTNMLPKNFCIAPFVQHTTHPSGSSSPCPYLGGDVFFNQHKTILDQWLDPDLDKLRTDFLNNQQNPICNRCWNEEAHGKRSLRQRLFDVDNASSDYQFSQVQGFAEMLEDSILDQSFKHGPKVLTIKNGNICNARCRICYPECSSRWIADARKINILTKQSWYNETVVEQNWSDSQIEEIVDLSKNLSRLELFGGEPLYNKQVKKLLDQIIDAGHAKNITLYINTNGTVNFLETLPNVTNFKNLEIGVSIDGVGAQFNYIRNGADYAQVIANVRKWKKELSPDRFWIDCITTVNILNIYYLPEIKSEMTSIFGMPPFWNLLVEPKYLSIVNMPASVKSCVEKKLSSDVEFADLISTMHQTEDLLQWDKFKNFTESIDEIRNESFSTTFPEFFEICSSH